MDPQNNYWYLEHIVTGKKIILQSGENTLGRHSTCKLVLKDYDYLSRQHAKITVDITNSVILEQMTTPNGVFVNQTKLAKDVYVYSLKNGDRIGLGVEVQRNEAVHPRYAVFILKENRVNIKDIIIISDDEDEEENYLLENNFGNKKPIDNLNIDRDRPSPANKPLSLKADKKPSGSIHLPILPEVKQEILSQASKEIENIFGEPDEELLESVLNINPYIYKQLNNNNLSTAGKKLCDGEKIEVPEEINMPENKLLVSKPSNPSIIDEIVLDDEEYDENFAMSQAVLREMKEEMADEFIELSDNEIDEQNEKNQLCNFKTEIATQHIEDEIILIEDEYDDLFSKVTDWSSKLLSQNVMSQVYPLEDEELQSPIDEMDVGKQALQFCTESRSCSIEDDHTNVTFHKGTRTTAPQVDSSVSEYNTVSPEVCKIRRCRILLKPISKPQCQTINQESTESKKMLEQVSDCCSKKKYFFRE